MLSGHAVREAVRRAGVDGAEIEDLILGCAIQQGPQGYNIGRLTVASAGLPESVAGMTIDRKCGSGLMAVATAAKQVAEGAADIYPRLGPTSEWDTAAAHAVLLAAGGAVSTLDGSPLEYNTRESLLNPFFVAFGPRDHDWLALLR